MWFRTVTSLMKSCSPISSVRFPSERSRSTSRSRFVRGEEDGLGGCDERAHLVFLDGSSITLGPDSELVIDNFSYDADKKSGAMAVSVPHGTFTTRFWPACPSIPFPRPICPLCATSFG